MDFLRADATTSVTSFENPALQTPSCRNGTTEFSMTQVGGNGSVQGSQNKEHPSSSPLLCMLVRNTSHLEAWNSHNFFPIPCLLEKEEFLPEEDPFLVADLLDQRSPNFFHSGPDNGDNDECGTHNHFVQ